MKPETRMPRRYYDELRQLITDNQYPNNTVTFELTGKPCLLPQGNYCITVGFYTHPALFAEINNRIDRLMDQLDDTCLDITRLTATESMYFMDANV